MDLASKIRKTNTENAGTSITLIDLFGMVCLRSGKNAAKESIMAAQMVFGLIILFVSCAGTAFLLIEILMWAMGRLDDTRASSRSRMSAVEYQFASTISVQAKLARSFPLQGFIVSNIEAKGAHQQDNPFAKGFPPDIPLSESPFSSQLPHVPSD